MFTLSHAQQKLFRAIVVSLIALGLGALSLSVPRETIEEAVDAQFSDPTSSTNVSTSSAEAEPKVMLALVTGVIDGDTIKIEIDNKSDVVRVLGINTPEVVGSPRGAECYGGEATKEAHTLLGGQTVTLTTDSSQAYRDSYDRLLASVTLSDGTDFGSKMLQGGLAKEYTFVAPYQNQTLYRRIEAEAKQKGIGLWGCR